MRSGYLDLVIQFSPVWSVISTSLSRCYIGSVDMRPHRGVLCSPGVYLDNLHYLHYHCENRQGQAHNSSTRGISTTSFSDRKNISIFSIKPINLLIMINITTYIIPWWHQTDQNWWSVGYRFGDFTRITQIFSPSLFNGKELFKTFLLTITKMIFSYILLHYISLSLAEPKVNLMSSFTFFKWAVSTVSWDWVTEWAKLRFNVLQSMYIVMLFNNT